VQTRETSRSPWGTRSGGSVFGKLGPESRAPCRPLTRGTREEWLGPIHPLVSVRLLSPIPQGIRANVRRGVSRGTGPRRSRRFISKL
jgi:hypothetical protein